MLKIYQSIDRIRLSTSVFIDGDKNKEVAISFDRGSSSGRFGTNKKNGCFYTNNPVIQKTIEADFRYGRDFILIAEESESSDSGIESESDSDNIDNAGAIKDGSPTELTNIPEVCNKQQAIEFLSQKQIEIKKTENVDSVKAIARESGYLFPNW